MNGFTLLESVVAMAVLALLLVNVYQIFGTTLRRAAEQRQREWAWQTAQSLLEATRADPALAPGHREGHALGTLTWEIRIEPVNGYDQTVVAAQMRVPAALLVTVRVNWGLQPSRHIELRSIELEPLS
jgi:prepilin-type N-terminal cleavage/methylation domain-containing protein